MANRNIYSVAQVNSYIKKYVRSGFYAQTGEYKGRGEQLQVSHERSLFISTIKDAGAAMNTIMFAGSRAARTFLPR